MTRRFGEALLPPALNFPYVSDGRAIAALKKARNTLGIPTSDGATQLQSAEQLIKTTTDDISLEDYARARRRMGCR
jgi:hypothetical protein